MYNDVDWEAASRYNSANVPGVLTGLQIAYLAAQWQTLHPDAGPVDGKCGPRTLASLDAWDPDSATGETQTLKVTVVAVDAEGRPTLCAVSEEAPR